MTDAEGYFTVRVPDNMDTSEILNVFSQNGTRVIRYKETDGTVRIVIERKPVSARKTEKFLAQKWRYRIKLNARVRVKSLYSFVRALYISTVRALSENNWLTAT